MKLTKPMVNMLSYLKRRGHLGDVMMSSNPTVAALEKRELVQRAPNPRETITSLYRITEAGKAALEGGE